MAGRSQVVPASSVANGKNQVSPWRVSDGSEERAPRGGDVCGSGRAVAAGARRGGGTSRRRGRGGGPGARPPGGGPRRGGGAGGRGAGPPAPIPGGAREGA